MPELRKPWQWQWMPTTVFCVGMFSIILVLWAGWVSEKQRSVAGLVDAIMDVQIRTATYHLSLEEAIAGNTQVDVKKVTDDMDQVIKQTDFSRIKGKYRFERIVAPLTDRNLRTQSEEIRALLVRFKMLGLAQLRNPEDSGPWWSADSEFHNVFREILTKARVLEDNIRAYHVANQKKSRLIFLTILAIWVPIVIGATAGLWSRERRKTRTERELLMANEQLLAQTEELTDHREHLATLVKKQTLELTTSNQLLRAEVAERKQTAEILKQTDGQIRHLTSELINAQEVERRRISIELHDALGQALNATKLHMRIIEKGLKEDQREIREECEALMDYMDDIIEDVRRLSLALSPTVLEDLGLTSALKWLISGLSRVPDMKTTADIEEIDHLLPRNLWITVYRVIQEAVTNIGKHSSAQNVFIDIRRRGDSVFFLVEDDGKGFDLEQQSGKTMLERGLGLTTMTERVRAMGGVLNLQSQETKGTRVAFSIPLEREEV
jgi:signal transduction histidine kinase